MLFVKKKKKKKKFFTRFMFGGDIKQELSGLGVRWMFGHLCKQVFSVISVC
jgi:hypothetical protein